jgi:LmbE family N-acetylglucosaminyl deacetylase
MQQKKSKSKPALVAVFAHPDDEAFGPAGTLATFAKSHNVYLLCATKGEEGGENKKIAQIRQKELLASAKILGIKKVYFLGFKDGTLCNNLYHKLAVKIEEKLKELKPDLIITFEPRGISGHIDHMVVSMVTTYVYKKLKFIKKLLYYCILEEEKRNINNYFIYFPAGYKRSDLGQIVNIKDVWQTKLKAMRVHVSQKHDANRIIKVLKDLPREEHFLIFK